MNQLAQIQDELIQIARKDLGLQPPIPEGELSLFLDSMQRLTLVVAIEDHYSICFEPEDEEVILTFTDVAKLIQKKLGGAAP